MCTWVDSDRLGWGSYSKREISEAAQHSKPETLSFSSPIQAGLSLGSAECVHNCATGRLQ
jgi:hypothetical protein